MGAGINASGRNWIELGKDNQDNQSKQQYVILVVHKNSSMVLLCAVIVFNPLVIGPTRSRSDGNQVEWEGGQTHLPEQIN